AKFLNAAIEFGYAGDAQQLLGELATIENVLGRPNSHPQNVSRTIDLDLLYFDDLEIETADLQLPHPRMTEREFVLRPLADIRPDLILPKQREPVQALLFQVRHTGIVVRISEEW